MTAKKAIKRRETAGQLARYLDAPYVRMIIPNAKEGGYIAEVLEMPGCITEGDTLEEAYQNLDDAMTGWLAASLRTNRRIPEPVGEKEYSGHFPLRMPTELHRAAAMRAMQEEVSLNQWIVRAVAAQVATENLRQDFANEVAAKVLDGLQIDVAANLRVTLGRLESSVPSGSDLVETWIPASTLADEFPAVAGDFASSLRTVIHELTGEKASGIECPKEVKENASG